MWDTVRLDQVVELQRGHDLPVQARQHGDIPVLGSNGIVGFHNEAPYTGPGVTIGRSGVIGGATYTEEPYWPLNTCLFVKDFKGNNTRWVYYWLKSADFSAMDSGSAQPSLNRNYIAGLSVPLPSRTEQNAIAEVLGALDDKITANNKLIDAANALAEAQFHSSLDEAESKPLSSFANFINGKAFTKGASGTGRVVVRIAELNSGIGNSTVFSDAEVDEKHVARPGDILFAWSGSLTLHRWFRDEAIVNQHIFKVVPAEGMPSWLIYELLRNKLRDFKKIAANKATTMGHIQRKHLDELVLVPNEVSQRAIAGSMELLWRTALNTERENQTLAATRDVLLPQLMSGKLRVKDAETLVESVV